ncbi:LysR substrate-binding domain-containing protein [Streptomyces sp. NBC_00536]|uniref:LysR substrate-binding domain-containing protein n=1 Tax=Streptomyces sp. NBC_00536 TaxID=2975769 RepID=UPI003FCC28E3
MVGEPVASILAGLRKDQPGLEVELHELSTAEQLARMAAHELDAGVIHHPCDTTGLELGPVLRRELGVLLPPASPLAVWERFVIARETVAEVLAESPGNVEVPPAVVVGGVPEPVVGGVPGSVVPMWREGLAAEVLAPDYRQLVDVLAGGSVSVVGAMDCRQLAVAVGLEPVPAKVEGLRSKVKRLAARGWLAEERPGMFSAVAGRGGGS